VEECVARGLAALAELKHGSELIVVDNGSDDGSADLALAAGARVVREPRRGYGSAYLAGFAAAQGEYIVMLDADLTYDFADIPRFVAQLEAGADFVMGNRRGRVRPGAMPWLHQHVGNPLMTRALNTLFRTGLGDAWCGMRGFRRDALPRLDLRTTGMEFALEMVIRASKVGLETREIPIELHPRGGESKLARYRDGWRGLRFMLLHSPTHLFAVPGVLAAITGAIVMLAALMGLPGPESRMHALIGGSLLTVFATQVLGLGLCARAYGSYFLEDREGRFDRLRSRLRLEHGLAAGGATAFVGLILGVAIVARWADQGLSGLFDERMAIVAATLMLVGMQVVFTSFLVSILGLRRRARPGPALTYGLSVAHAASSEAQSAEASP